MAEAKSGWLRKRPVHRSFGAVQKRWITLHEAAIEWRKEPGEEPLGKLSLHILHVSPPLSLPFFAS